MNVFSGSRSLWVYTWNSGSRRNEVALEDLEEEVGKSTHIQPPPVLKSPESRAGQPPGEQAWGRAMCMGGRAEAVATGQTHSSAGSRLSALLFPLLLLHLPRLLLFLRLCRVPSAGLFAVPAVWKNPS